MCDSYLHDFVRCIVRRLVRLLFAVSYAIQPICHVIERAIKGTPLGRLPSSAALLTLIHVRLPFRSISRRRRCSVAALGELFHLLLVRKEERFQIEASSLNRNYFNVGIL